MVDISHYATETDVYYESGITKEAIMRITDMTDSEVTTLINSFLKSAEGKIKDLLDIPHLVPRELHLGTGEDDEFQLGPEDECLYFDEEVEGLVESVKHCFFRRTRMKRPYPKGCDEHTDDATKYGVGTGTVVTNDADKKQAGDYAMAIAFAATPNNYAYYPSTQDLNKNIDIYDFVSFRAETTDETATFEIRLYDKDGNYDRAYFILPKTGRSYIINLDIDEDFEHGVGSIDWDTTNLYYWQILSDTECTLYLDNFNINDEWFFTAPSGKLVIPRKMISSTNYTIDYSIEVPPADGFPFYVTYTYDPFKATVPENIKSATAQFASIKLIDHLLGIRQAAIAFEFEGETLLRLPDKETLYAKKGWLLARAKENLASYGYGFAGTATRGYA